MAAKSEFLAFDTGKVDFLILKINRQNWLLAEAFNGVNLKISP